MPDTRPPARLVLEDGSVFHGFSVGATGTSFGEMVFNTALTGYQEILTDPSYKGQIVLMTYPEIGNYGVNAEDIESQDCHAAGLVVRKMSRVSSSWRAEEHFDHILRRQGIVGIEGVDTRAITRRIRDIGSPKTAITSESIPITELIPQIQALPDFVEQDFVNQVSTKDIYILRGKPENPAIERLIVIDFGIKQSILEQLKPFAEEIIVMPASSRLPQILAFQPDAVFLSNGPGDPNALAHAVQRTKDLMAHEIPIFGICLGHQILTLACGGRVVKMPFGHHGGNHPVKDMLHDTIIITSQNHSYSASDSDFPADTLEITHLNLNDGSIEGFRHKTKPVMGIQFHPEAGPGPHDARYLFGDFFERLKSHRLAWA